MAAKEEEVAVNHLLRAPKLGAGVKAANATQYRETKTFSPSAPNFEAKAREAKKAPVQHSTLRRSIQHLKKGGHA